MIKSILDESEDQLRREIAGEDNQPAKPETQPEETVLTKAQSSDAISPETETLLEIPDLRKPETPTQIESFSNIEIETSPETSFSDEAKTEKRDEEPIILQSDFKPETPAETIRKSGMAYAAAITLFGSIVFMLILGWFFDLLVGTSPWGIVGGIVIGAILGFFQFFRLTSQIINDKKQG